MKKIILISFMCFGVFGYSQQNILKDKQFKEYEKEVVTFRTSKDYLNYEKLKNTWMNQSDSDVDLSSDEAKNNFYTKLKEAYDVISAKEKEITQERALLIKDYGQDEFYKANQLINKQIFEINNP